ncbi:hypothetical protein NCAS_0H02380 [Naumovozyma castellii]|uniref:Mitochondrial distribution and morphology protein 32 n=1 Tax=Naumovozyma castellii TaxID=27288 RepID=G0VJ69_NAUCA|nr:hypothetical protein NCAS_0H02380 [Naumovozyma castellii CBS 4309]CCC71548.1 hypothetical protein NCAS_0H02380 [Naumovozyma castellii CBS 4309]
MFCSLTNITAPQTVLIGRLTGKPALVRAFLSRKHISTSLNNWANVKKHVTAREPSPFISNTTLIRPPKSSNQSQLKNRSTLIFNAKSPVFSWKMFSKVCWFLIGTAAFVSVLPYAMDTSFTKRLIDDILRKVLQQSIKDNDLINISFKKGSISEWRSYCIQYNDLHVETNHSNDFMKFEFLIHQVEISLSLKKWMLGKGIINDISLFGLNGDVMLLNENTGFSIDDIYELRNVKINDSTLKIIDLKTGKTNKLAIFNLEMPKLNTSTMLIDLLNANVATGSINNSLFSLHKRQHKSANLNDLRNDLSTSFQRITRLRLNSIDVNELGLTKNRAFNWIQDGSVEIFLDIMLPPEDPHSHNNELHRSQMSNDNKYIVFDLKFKFKDLKGRLPTTPPQLSTNENILSLDELKPVISFVNIQRLLFNTIKDQKENNLLEVSTSPMWSSPNVSVRKKKSVTPSLRGNKTPLISTSSDEKQQHHQNTNNIQTFNIPHNLSNEIIVSCKIVKNLQDFEEKISFKDTGIYDQLSMELYVDLVKMVEEWEYSHKNEWMKQWGTNFASQLILFGFGAIV